MFMWTVSLGAAPSQLHKLRIGDSNAGQTPGNCRCCTAAWFSANTTERHHLRL